MARRATGAGRADAAARQRQVQLVLARRSAHARRRRHCRCASASPKRSAPTLPKIPVVVLSASEAAASDGGARRTRGGRRVFAAGCEAPYRVGPGPAAVRLTVDMDQRLRPIYDVVASMRARPHPSVPCSSARITTHGRSAASTRAPGTTALLEVAQGPGPAGEERLAAIAHDRVCVLGRRGVRAGRLHRVRGGLSAPACRSSSSCT